MAINFGTQVYNPTYAVFARPIIVTPIKSQPNQPAYGGRGVYASVAIDTDVEDNVISDQRTILDIIEQEFPILPMQGDTVEIPAVADLPALGIFTITDVDSLSGFETTMTLRKHVTKKP